MATEPQSGGAMLERFRQAKADEIAALRVLKAEGAMPAPLLEKSPPFCLRLKQQAVAVIAEYKRASPSKGEINMDLTPQIVAQDYAEAGAGALSVLTEETYFKGSLNYLQHMLAPDLPLLRKDFIYHPLQVERTAATPASAILLIVRCLDDVLLTTLIETSLSFGLEPVVEVFDAHDLKRAQKAGAQIIQVNNRDLDTLRMDDTISRDLIIQRTAKEFWITASGIDSHKGLMNLLNLGFDAALIGSSLMEGGRPGDKLASIIKG